MLVHNSPNGDRSHRWYLGLHGPGNAGPRTRPSGPRALCARLGHARRAIRGRARPEARPQRVAPNPALHHERRSAVVWRRRRLSLPRPRESRADRPSHSWRRGRSLRSAPLPRFARLRVVVRVRASGLRVPFVLVVRPSGGCPAHGTARRQSRVLRNGCAPRPCPDPRPDRARCRLRRRHVRDDRSGPLTEVDFACGSGSGERRPVRRWHASPRPGDRLGARLPGGVRAASPSGPARADRHLLRALSWRRSPCRSRGALRGQPRGRGARAGARPRACARPAHGRRGVGVFEDRSTGGTIVICALDNLGKGAAGQAVQNVNLLFGFEETMGLRLSGVLV